LGNNEAFISSNADVDQFTKPGVDFLTGNLDQLYGSININFAAGRHQIMVSDESETLASTNTAITDHLTSATTADGLGLLAATSEILITGMGQGGGGISYQGGNFDDGIEYWFGSGSDHIYIDGTMPDNLDGKGGRTTTMLNTGLGDDYVKV